MGFQFFDTFYKSQKEEQEKKKVKKKWIVIPAMILGFGWWMWYSTVSIKENVISDWQLVRTVFEQRNSTALDIRDILGKRGFPDKDRLKNITEAEQKTRKATTIQELREADIEVVNAVQSALLVATNYPAIMSDEAFLQVKKDWDDKVEEAEVARKEYNDTIQEYNYRVKFFPYMFVAQWLGMKEKEYFRREEISRHIPKELYGIKEPKNPFGL